MNLPHRESLAGLGDGSGTDLDVLVLETGSESPLQQSADVPIRDVSHG
jgi:hypothetical protein